MVNVDPNVRHTWIFRSLIPEHVLQVPSIAVVCPVPFTIGPETDRIALLLPVGYPTVLISWFGWAKRRGAWIKYVLCGQS